MPLDLKKVITQLKNVEKQELCDLSQNKLDSTYKVFKIACEDQKKLLSRVEETQSTGRASFSFAVPDLTSEKLDKLFECEKNFSLPHITIATDGSQINPSHHEFTNASLINIGLVVIPYFNSSISVQLTSDPTIYTSLGNENIEEEDLISYERTLKEVEALVELAKKHVSYKLPIVALLDGTLIHWHIERFSNVFVERFIKRYSDAILALKSLGVTVASFLSNSRSNDVINMLRVFKCPYDFVDCKKHCSGLESKNLPCNPTLEYKPVLDRRLIQKFFTDHETPLGVRTILFKSNSKILNYYPEDLKIFFFYVNTGSEIARVELPAYVAKDSKLLGLLHNAIALQCKVGFGYPVTLSEAHLQAVVNQKDRQIFYDLVMEQVLKKTQAPVKLSNKELKKRISFV